MVPLPGQLLFYPGGISEVEILFPYGPTVFASVAGTLAGNHFLTLDLRDPRASEDLTALGQLVQWQGAQEIVFELLPAPDDDDDDDDDDDESERRWW